MLGPKIKFEGVKGVGTVELDLQEGQQVYTLIGENGVGKTKTLESLFQALFFTNCEVQKLLGQKKIVFNKQGWSFRSVVGLLPAMSPVDAEILGTYWGGGAFGVHKSPTVLLASQNRGFIQHESIGAASLGDFEQRKLAYLKRTIESMGSSFSSMNMDISIESWFVTLAQSSNPYQKQKDNRDIEIKTVLSLLNILDRRIDSGVMEIGGDGRVSLKIDGQLRELSHLSTGFASILKMIQAIISGYGYFTNEVNLDKVKGVVLIDEIESHLHLSWQAKIIPLLKNLFPNTTFYITTHSSVVLSQLNEGEAYRLDREADGVVRTKILESPNKSALVDVLRDAFDIDLNKMKRERMSAEQQKHAKEQLLSLLNQQGSKAQ